MTLLWCDGFDHYGLDENNMLDGPWAEILVPAVDRLKVSTALPRAGTHSLEFKLDGTSSANPLFIRRVLGAPLATAGIGGAFYVTSLPVVNGALGIINFRDAANASQLTVCIQSTGAIAVYRGIAGDTLLGTSTILMTAAAFNHIEVKVTIDDDVGAVEVRLNNVTVLDLSGVDTQATGNAETSQIAIGRLGPTGAGSQNISRMYVDDVFAWDTTGSYNKDFIGDHQVITLWPNGDTGQTDWIRNTGSTDFETIDEADPDDDTTYVEADGSSQISEYDLDDLPSLVSSIAAVQPTARMKKTDAGGARVQQSLISGGSEFNGADRNITTFYTYWPDISEVDPNTSLPWTKTALDAALYKIERTA